MNQIKNFFVKALCALFFLQTLRFGMLSVNSKTEIGFSVGHHCTGKSITEKEKEYEKYIDDKELKLEKLESEIASKTNLLENEVKYIGSQYHLATISDLKDPDLKNNLLAKATEIAEMEIEKKIIEKNLKKMKKEKEFTVKEKKCICYHANTSIEMIVNHVCGVCKKENIGIFLASSPNLYNQAGIGSRPLCPKDVTIFSEQLSEDETGLLLKKINQNLRI